MSNLTFGERAKIALNPGQILRVTTPGSAEVEILEGGPLGTTTVTASSQEYGPYSVAARLIVESLVGLVTYGLTEAAPLSAAQLQGFARGQVVDAQGAAHALSEAVTVVPLTANGTAFTGACEFRGFVVRSESGGTADVTIYDALSATGTAIMTVANVSVGAYYWDGNWMTPGVGTGGRRVNSTGCHVVIAGTATIDVMVG